MSGISIEDRPSTLGQSQSVMNIPRMSPKAESKKRRAPALPGAPTPSMGYASFEGYQVRGLKSCLEFECVVKALINVQVKHRISPSHRHENAHRNE